jgi:hypothetical protein
LRTRKFHPHLPGEIPEAITVQFAAEGSPSR